jgi:hypothetical protein
VPPEEAATSIDVLVDVATATFLSPTVAVISRHLFFRVLDGSYLIKSVLISKAEKITGKLLNEKRNNSHIWVLSLIIDDMFENDEKFTPVEILDPNFECDIKTRNTLSGYEDMEQHPDCVFVQVTEPLFNSWVLPAHVKSSKFAGQAIHLGIPMF